MSGAQAPSDIYSGMALITQLPPLKALMHYCAIGGSEGPWGLATSRDWSRSINPSNTRMLANA